MKEMVSKLNFYRPPRPDDFIQQEVHWTLSQSGILGAGRVEVAVERGVVRLKGDVFTPHQKRIAGACVEEIPGVRHVENQLKIRRVSRFRDDHSMHGF